MREAGAGGAVGREGAEVGDEVCMGEGYPSMGDGQNMKELVQRGVVGWVLVTTEWWRGSVRERVELVQRGWCRSGEAVRLPALSYS